MIYGTNLSCIQKEGKHVCKNDYVHPNRYHKFFILKININQLNLIIYYKIYFKLIDLYFNLLRFIYLSNLNSTNSQLSNYKTYVILIFHLYNTSIKIKKFV